MIRLDHRADSTTTPADVQSQRFGPGLRVKGRTPASITHAEHCAQPVGRPYPQCPPPRQIDEKATSQLRNDICEEGVGWILKSGSPS